MLAFQAAPSQVKVGSGTAMFVVYTQDVLTIAADSRMTLLTGPPKDTECKISAFGHEFTFAMAGVTFQNSGQTPHSIARQIWKTESNEGDVSKLVSTVAEEWTKRMEDLYRQLGPEIGEIRKRTHGEPLATAYFAATNKAGQMGAASSEIGFDGRLFDQTGEVRITHHIQSLQANQWYSAGLQEITVEYVKETSKRANEYMTQFKAQIATLPPSEQDAKLAAKYIELSIQLHPRKEYLAFPVDVLQLKRAVGVNWVSVKPNCPRN
jgi:hypothetical protein